MLSKEKKEWLSSIGAKEFPEPVKYMYAFPGMVGEATFTFSEDYLERTPLEELQAQYNKNYDAAIKTVEWRILSALHFHATQR